MCECVYVYVCVYVCGSVCECDKLLLVSSSLVVPVMVRVARDEGEDPKGEDVSDFLDNWLREGAGLYVTDMVDKVASGVEVRSLVEPVCSEGGSMD